MRRPAWAIPPRRSCPSSKRRRVPPLWRWCPFRVQLRPADCCTALHARERRERQSCELELCASFGAYFLGNSRAAVQRPESTCDRRSETCTLGTGGQARQGEARHAKGTCKQARSRRTDGRSVTSWQRKRSALPSRKDASAPARPVSCSTPGAQSPSGAPSVRSSSGVGSVTGQAKTPRIDGGWQQAGEDARSLVDGRASPRGTPRPAPPTGPPTEHE